MRDQNISAFKAKPSLVSVQYEYNTEQQRPLFALSRKFSKFFGQEQFCLLAAYGKRKSDIHRCLNNVPNLQLERWFPGIWPE